MNATMIKEEITGLELMIETKKNELGVLTKSLKRKKRIEKAIELLTSEGVNWSNETIEEPATEPEPVVNDEPLIIDEVIPEPIVNDESIIDNEAAHHLRCTTDKTEFRFTKKFQGLIYSKSKYSLGDDIFYRYKIKNGEEISNTIDGFLKYSKEIFNTHKLKYGNDDILILITEKVDFPHISAGQSNKFTQITKLVADLNPKAGLIFHLNYLSILSEADHNLLFGENDYMVYHRENTGKRILNKYDKKYPLESELTFIPYSIYKERVSKGELE